MPLLPRTIAATALLAVIATAQADLPSAGASFAMRLQNSANSTNRGSGDLLFWGLFNPEAPPSEAGATVWSFAAQCPLGISCAASVSGAGWVRQRILARDFSTQPLQYYGARAYDPNLTGAWNIWLSTDSSFASGTRTIVAAPPVGAVAAMPFVQSMSLQSAGLTPTVSWTLPASATSIDQVQVRVFDNSHQIPSISMTPTSPGSTQQSDVIYTQTVASGQSLTLPAGLLQYGTSYSLAISLDHLRGDHSVQSRSQSFFDYTPIDPASLVGAPTNIALPTLSPVANVVGAEQGPVYQFHVDSVSADAVTFIDPAIASGFDYRTGIGDPNFKSVQIASQVGDGLYEVYLWDGSAWTLAQAGLAAGAGFDFVAAGHAGGVDRFQIRGIEPSAELSAFDPTAFVTGLTFTGTGSFTGTMQAIVAVPEPATLALWLAGFGLLGLARRKALRS
ncbi:PEP-CTERM sorting domain-containing protein [Paucibacter sediminis]|uniref:PEP-CTERM sorting domain-containing protein n=1 Tax=Paucibacter sediminis TaxID=3019553 RepID=A0AA95SVB3_9BURK|nr:PEP-CTERM sorting domain-containing protein [Paucibacter sp. S2-9]WIT11299.1 PEP-CTERM sorting domain-containing protein [Paucibacter sp. S2-9]